MPAAPAPAARGCCHTVPAGLGCSADGAAAGVRPQTHGVGGGRAGPTYPFCCGAPSASRGAPKGRAVLLREALGAKVYRGGSAAGARAWAETEPQSRAGRAGAWAGVGRPPGAERTVALQPRPHTSGQGLQGRRQLEFQGAHLGAMISAHAGRRADEHCLQYRPAGGSVQQTGRHAWYPDRAAAPGPTPSSPDSPQLRPPPSTRGEGQGY